MNHEPKSLNETPTSNSVPLQVRVWRKINKRAIHRYHLPISGRTLLHDGLFPGTLFSGFCPVGRQPFPYRITEGLPVIRPQAAESLQIGPFHVRVVGLPWLAPSQTPQSARREDEGEATEPAERPECPNEEEAAGGLGDLAVMCPPHVHDGHGCREQ